MAFAETDLGKAGVDKSKELNHGDRELIFRIATRSLVHWNGINLQMA